MPCGPGPGGQGVVQGLGDEVAGPAAGAGHIDVREAQGDARLGIERPKAAAREDERHEAERQEA